MPSTVFTLCPAPAPSSVTVLSKRSPYFSVRLLRAPQSAREADFHIDATLNTFLASPPFRSSARLRAARQDAVYVQPVTARDRDGKPRQARSRRGERGSGRIIDFFTALAVPPLRPRCIILRACGNIAVPAHCVERAVFPREALTAKLGKLADQSLELDRGPRV